jgi:hypothetical protein
MTEAEEGFQNMIDATRGFISKFAEERGPNGFTLPEVREAYLRFMGETFDKAQAMTKEIAPRDQFMRLVADTFDLVAADLMPEGEDTAQ